MLCQATVPTARSWSTSTSNKAGLARALAATDVLSHPPQIDQFFCSFSQSRSLFQFIDCGQVKERFDAKLRVAAPWWTLVEDADADALSTDTFRFYAYRTLSINKCKTSQPSPRSGACPHERLHCIDKNGTT